MLKDLHEIAMGAMIKNSIENNYVVSFESVGPMTMKKQSGIQFTIGEISNWVTKWILANPEAIRQALQAAGYKEGHNRKYIGLAAKDSKEIDDFKDEPTQAKLFYVSYKLDKKCIAEIQQCSWTDENIDKFRQDMIKIGRLYQEKTIDYAKKISFLDIIPSPMRFIRALSLMPLSVALVGDKVSVGIPEALDDNRITINDDINKTRVQFANEYKEYVEETVIPEINLGKLPKEMDAELQRLRYSPDVAAFVEMKAYYKDIVGGFIRVQEQGPDSEDESIDVAKESFKDDKARIENMIRLSTRYMTPEQRGAYMKYIAGRTKGNQKREDGSENRFYLSLCREEFIKWLLSMGLNEIDFAGYRLLGNKGYQAGDMVWFENGQAGKSIIDGQYTGWLNIKDVNGVLYGTVDINDLIVIPEADNKIIVKIQQKFVSQYGADTVIKALNRAEDVTFRAGKDNWALEIACSDGKIRKISYDLGKTFFDMFKDMTGKIVKVSKNTVRTMTGAMIDSVYVSIDLNAMPEILVPTGSVINMTEDPGSFEIEESDEI